MGRLKCNNQNKDARNYSDHSIDLFLKSIKYFNRINLNRSCSYRIRLCEKPWTEYDFESIYDAIRMILEYKPLFAYSNIIELGIIYKDITDNEYFYKFDNSDLLEIKNQIELHANSAKIVFDKNMNQVYYVSYFSGKEFDGTTYSYDMKYLYDKESCIKLEPYTAYETDIYTDFEKYSYGIFKFNIRTPWFIEPQELNQANTPMKYNSSGYGFGGNYQIARNGYISTDDSYNPPNKIMPMAAIRPCKTKRPIITGISRYKAIIKFPDGRTFPYYAECKTGDMKRFIELIADYDWHYQDICQNPEDYIQSIEVVPDGEWF